jgi:hypothetical protein
MNLTASLNSKTVAELRKLAASYNIAGRSTMKKGELVAVLAHDGLAELSIAIENIDDAAQERFAEQVGQSQQPNEVAILRDAPGRAIVTAAFDGRTVGGSIVRVGRRYMLTAGTITIKANTFEKIAKLFAKRLGFRADVISIDRAVC